MPLRDRGLVTRRGFDTIDCWLNLPAERQFIFMKDEEAVKAGVLYLATQGSDATKVWYIVTPERPVEASAPLVMLAGAEAFF